VYDKVGNQTERPDLTIAYTPFGLNPYSYVMNSPLKYVDPTGIEPDPELVKIYGPGVEDTIEVIGARIPDRDPSVVLPLKLTDGAPLILATASPAHKTRKGQPPGRPSPPPRFSPPPVSPSARRLARSVSARQPPSSERRP
jgi:hypothetical protein